MRSLRLAGLALLTTTSVGNAQSYFDAIGYTALQARLGTATPTGAGIVVAQIEAQEAPNAYLPNPAISGTKTVNVTDMSGGGLLSGHATGVGQLLYGDSSQSIASGITDVLAYKVTGDLSSGDWIGPAYLNIGSASAPLTHAARVQNHSYVSTGTNYDNPGILAILRRLDFVVRRDNVVAVVGVDGFDRTPVIPELLGNGYNTIAVGLTTGNSSVGPTTGDTTGRSKPDIVAPMGTTSAATPVVAAAAALLLNVADAKSGSESLAAGRAETIKAVLLSGATISEFASLPTPWTRELVTINDVTFRRPLDNRFGAGELNIDTSHRILSTAQANGTDQVVEGLYGWDFTTMTGVGATRTYYLDVPDDGVTSADLTATVTWLRRVTLHGASLPTATLSEVHLRLRESDANYTLGAVIDESISPIDNVQHIRTSGLSPGRRYALEVTLATLPPGQLSEDVAVAWALVPIPEPWGLLVIVAATLRVRRQGRR